MSTPYRTWIRCATGRLVALSLLLNACAACGAQPKGSELTRFSYTEYHMGIDARIVVYARDKRTAESACTAAFARIAAMDQMMSDYRPSSELMRLCAEAGGPPVKVSPELFTVLRRGQEVARQSNGDFDITVGPLVLLWREARKTGKLPDPAAIARARQLVGWLKIELDEKRRTAKLTTPGMKLDLGGIAKGYAGDEAQKALKRRGIKSALVEMGGDIVVSGAPPGSDGWTVRVPNAGTDQGPADLKLADCAISTSGDTEQFVEIGGKRYSHLVDPHTGEALTSRVQVSVIAPNGLTSDPLTKAVSMMSEAERNRLLQAYPGVRAYVRVIDGAKPAAVTFGPEWTPLFDGKALGNWKRTPFAGGGEVKIDPAFRGGPPAIVVEAGSSLSGFNWTANAPKTNFEIELECMKIQGDDFMCGLTFPVGESHASLILGGWGGGVVGISSIDSQDASENETTKYIRFETDKWYRVRMRVTPEKLEAWLDDKQIVNVEIGDRKISLRPGAIVLQRPLGISTYVTSSAFRNLRLRTLPAK